MSGKLVRGLSLMDAVSLVVGTIIGTGVFLKSGTMAQQVGSPIAVLVVWVVAGLLSLAGALTYAELGSMFPEAGGEYVYLREAYGNVPAFLYGWMRFLIASPGTIAAYAVGAATFLKGASESLAGYETWIGFFFIIFFTLLNCMQVKVGGRLNSAITVLKVTMMLCLIIGVLFFSDSFAWSNLDTSEGATFTYGGFGLAMLSALWAYDGWNNMPMAAGEIQNPQRNIPLSLTFGVLLVLVIYLLVNLGYFMAMPFEEALMSNSDQYPDALPIATKAAQTFLGVAGIGIVSILFVISALGAMNGSVLTNARVPYAMAQDRLFFRELGIVHEKSNVPLISVVVQGVIASAMAFMGTFNQLTDYVIFASWVFYVAVAAAVFVLRKKKPDQVRSYRVWGYPVVPFIFIVVAILLVVNTIAELPTQSLYGLGIILLGIPVYYLFHPRWNK